MKLLLVLLAVAAAFAADQLPGLDAGIGQGFDLVYGAKRGIVLDWHWNNHNSFSSNEAGGSFPLPDEVTAVSIDNGRASTNFLAMRNSSEYVSSAIQSYGLKVGEDVTWVLAQDATTKHIKSLFQNNATVWKVDRLRTLGYRSLKGQSESLFSKILNTLPQEYETNSQKQAYSAFIQEFGTHYFSHTTLGASFSYIISVDNALFDKYSPSWVRSQMMLEIRNLDIKFGYEQGEPHKIEEDFLNSIKVETYFVGATKQDFEAGFDNWIAAVKKQPGVVKSTLVPMAMTATNSAVKMNLKKAIDEYVQAQQLMKANIKSFAILAGDDLPPVPGIANGVGFGYDVVEEVITAQLVPWTWEYGNQWSNPYTQRDEKVPDQVTCINDPYGSTLDQVDIFKSWESFWSKKTSWMGFDVSLDFKGVQVGAGFKKSQGEIKEFTRNLTRNFALEQNFLGYYRLSTIIPKGAKGLFTDSVDALPEEWDADAYSSFIMDFGTHYIQSARFGGKVNFSLAFDEEVVNNHTQEWTSQQINLSITYAKLKAGFNVGKNFSENQISKEFTQHSSNATQVYGGAAAVFQTQGFEQWLPTLPSNPGMLLDAQPRILPLSHLVVNPKKKALLDQATLLYINSNGKPDWANANF